MTQIVAVINGEETLIGEVTESGLASISGRRGAAHYHIDADLDVYIKFKVSAPPGIFSVDEEWKPGDGPPPWAPGPPEVT